MMNASKNLAPAHAEMMSALKGPGRVICLSWPEDISTVEIGYLMEVVNLQMNTYRRIASLREAGVTSKGDIEWNSWFSKGHPAIVERANTSLGLRD